jgi:hypothetical protein
MDPAERGAAGGFRARTLDSGPCRTLLSDGHHTNWFWYPRPNLRAAGTAPVSTKGNLGVKRLATHALIGVTWQF